MENIDMISTIHIGETFFYLGGISGPTFFHELGQVGWII